VTTFDEVLEPDGLFPELEPTVAPPAPKLSADRRRTLRQKADIARGVHPLTKLPLLKPEGHTCGDCAHRIAGHHHNRSYPKCDQHGFTHSAASDCRAWWPACVAWAPAAEAGIAMESN
jgi:hypothetical protein